MAISKQKKQEIVKTLNEKLTQAKSVVFFDYTGITVKETQNLKKKLKEVGAESMVAKKRLLKKALENKQIKNFDPSFNEGSLTVVFNNQDEVSGVKTLYQFAKKCKFIKVRGGVLDNNLADIETINKLSKIPNKEQLLVQIMSLLNGPTYGIANSTNSVISGLVRVIKAAKISAS